MKKTNAQLTGMAGEFLTAGKLFKRGYQASITFGNAKAIDILVYNPVIDKSFVVQVKTLRSKNCFLIKKENINKEHIYVFVVLYSDEKQEEYFIVKGDEILSNINEFFGSSYKRDIPSTMPAINYNPLKKYLNNWTLFDE
ncbi:MAG: hypothetical protein PHT69_15450 [Bacteroidales bacterium]|nr:hypothetical protein [Bacteroidales bacterium]